MLFFAGRKFAWSSDFFVFTGIAASAIKFAQVEEIQGASGAESVCGLSEMWRKRR